MAEDFECVEINDDGRIHLVGLKLTTFAEGEQVAVATCGLRGRLNTIDIAADKREICSTCAWSGSGRA